MGAPPPAVLAPAILEARAEGRQARSAATGKGSRGMTSLPIPAGALAQHLIALGKTRSGKSSKLRVLVEGLLDQGKPVGIIDPKGDWWGLKSSATGKSAGYPVVIFGGAHADVPINGRAGAQIAEVVAAGNRPFIIDMKGWTVADRTQFFIDFASTLFHKSRGARWLCIDEVHNFAPQGKIGDIQAGKALHWANRLASEGAGLGITLLSASQRPQKVHKDYVTSHETLIACRLTHNLDREAIKAWIDGCGDPAQGKDVLTSVALMPRENAWVWSPEIGFGPKLITFPLFRTYDSFKPQDIDTPTQPKGWAGVDLKEITAKLEKVVDEAKANDPATLRRRIAELETEARKAPAGVDKATFEKAVEAARRDAFMHGEAKGFSGALKGFGDHIAAVKALAHRSRQVLEQIEKVGANLQAWADRPSPVLAADSPASKSTTHSEIGYFKEPKLFTMERPPAKGSGEALPKGERICLISIAQHADGVTREQMTVLTGYKKSSRDAYIQRLRERGCIEVGERITATDHGVATLGPDYEPLPTGQALRDYWLDRLPEGEKRILSVLIQHHPRSVSRPDIDAATGYKKSSRDAYLQRLGARELVITEPGAAKASDRLFENGR